VDFNERFWASEVRGGFPWNLEDQERRDQAARMALYYAQRGEGNLSFCLYLRPFESVNRMTAQVASFAPDSSAGYKDFEHILLKAVETLGRAAPYTGNLNLVALGEYDAAIFGAGLAPSSEVEWRESFTALAGAVKLIVIVPSVRPGTLWELSQIVDKKMHRKTLFVMPESVQSREAQAEARQLWHQATEATRDMGIALPPYHNYGAIFRLSDDGGVMGIRPLRLTQRLRRVSNLRRAIAELRAI
jgi:hypothetical protein